MFHSYVSLPEGGNSWEMSFEWNVFKEVSIAHFNTLTSSQKSQMLRLGFGEKALHETVSATSWKIARASDLVSGLTTSRTADEWLRWTSAENVYFLC